MTQYLPHLAIFAMVLSPLFVPIAVTVVHWLKTTTWRQTVLPTVKLAIRRDGATRRIAVEAA